MAQNLEELQDQIQTCIVQRQNLESILNSVTDGIIAVDMDLRILNLNRATEHIIGYTRDEVAGQFCPDILGPLAKDDMLCAIFKEHQQVDACATEVFDKDGRVHHLLVSTHLLCDEAGSKKGLVAIMRDVTELETLRNQLVGRDGFCGLLGKNHQMQALYQLIEDMSDSDATVLVLGETGTGKELIAQAIHESSHRAKGPFVKVNCSALSEGLLESELFGHVKGAFTNAIKDKVGRFEQASGGTIFLDEIGDLSPSVQVKLLRVLQEREIERVGSGETIRIDTRVIAATHQNLEKAMTEGKFREDLFYRLNVMPLKLPPLRARLDDIPILVAHFIKKYNARTARNIVRVDDQVLSIFLDYKWPGNVRQLENAIEHAFIKCRDRVLLPHCLPSYLLQETPIPQPQLERDKKSEKAYVLEVLQKCQWNRSVAAQKLGWHRTTLWRKLKEWQ